MTADPPKPRKWAWRDAVKASDLSPGAKLVAYSFADCWRVEEDSPLLWVESERLQRETSLSPRSMQRAVAELRAEGWLVEVTKAGRGKAPRYLAAVVKVATMAMQDPERSPNLQERSPQWRPSSFRDTNHHHQARGATAEPLSPDGLVVGELDNALRKGLPANLAAATTTTAALRASLARLAELGWTTEALADATAARDWGGARPGAVQAWLRELPAPTRAVEVKVPGWCGECRGGWLGEDEVGRPVPCPTCRPHAVAGW